MADEKSHEFNNWFEKLIEREKDVKVFHIMIQWMDENQSQICFDFGVESRNANDDKWQKISIMFRSKGYTTSRYSADKCRHRFDKWLNFYANNYDKLEGHLEPKTQEIFDLMKIVHILDLDVLSEDYESIGSLIKDIGHRNEVKDYLNDLENQKLEIKPKPLSNKESVSEYKSLNKENRYREYVSESVREMVKEEEDIKFFNSMVKMFDPKAIYWKKTFNKWEEFSKVLKNFGYSSDTCSAQRCRDVFYKWSAFYAQNYFKLNNKLEPDFQQMFDLLKVVHTLDLNKMWRTDDPIHGLVTKISTDDEIQEYIKDFKKKCVNEVEDDIIVSKKVSKKGYERNGEKVFPTFEAMKLRFKLLQGINAYGLEKPSPIQKQAIVPIIKGRNVIAQAQSGTGKTAAFVIAILQRIDSSLNQCQALILTPTRELAQQIHDVVTQLGKFMKIKCQVCIGGTDVIDNVQKIRMGAQIMVGTSGRIYDMIEREAINPKTIKMFIVDEADHMLTGKHRDQFDDVFITLSSNVQLILTSATMSKEVLESTKIFMKNPIRILVNNEELTLEGIKQFYVNSQNEANKLSIFCDLFRTIETTQAFVYCNTREKVDLITQQMHDMGLMATHIHGLMEQRERNAILRGFKAGFCRILLTSDLLGRGIDVQQVSLVINYDLPTDHKTYIHRVGRGGRFGRKGVAINLVTDFELEDLKHFEKYYNTNIDVLTADLTELLQFD